MNPDTRRVADRRLGRIRAQVRRIQSMIHDGRTGADVLLQVAEARRALGKVAKMVLAAHLENCVVQVSRPDTADGEAAPAGTVGVRPRPDELSA